MKLLRAATALLEGRAAWARDLTEADVPPGGIGLHRRHRPAPRPAARPGHRGRRRPHGSPQVVLTSGPLASLTGRAATLAGTATTREELLPLAARRAEIPALATAMLASLARSDSVHLTPGAIQALSAHAWPGNLRELKAVVAAGRRPSYGGRHRGRRPARGAALGPGTAGPARPRPRRARRHRDRTARRGRQQGARGPRSRPLAHHPLREDAPARHHRVVRRTRTPGCPHPFGRGVSPDGPRRRRRGGRSRKVPHVVEVRPRAAPDDGSGPGPRREPPRDR